MVKKVIVKKATYRDSITLMKVSKAVLELKGVSQAVVVMATALNKRLLADVRFRGAEIEGAATDDLIVAIAAKNDSALKAAEAETERLLSPSEATPEGKPNPQTLEDALEVLPDANMVAISVPGQFAKREAMLALNRGLNVFLFSSNVSREDELELKKLAIEKHLLMMGPDCGTAMINHTVLGFGNAVREGSIGLVSASGTGLQEVSTLIHKAGLGISQAIGTGGGDLSEQVGGIMTTEGITRLERDEQTKTIVVISKPPNEKVEDRILRMVRRCRKRVVVNFLGKDPGTGKLGKQRRAHTLEDAARIACEPDGAKVEVADLLSKRLISAAESEYGKLAPSQRFVRGLFAGGTLSYEAQVILQPLFEEVYSNSPLKRELEIEGEAPSRKHVCIDMGAEEFVVGRAHSMIDFTLRKRRILLEAKDPETAVILLDVELGYGSNPNPAGELIPVIRQARNLARKAGRHLPMVASIVGTDDDFQGMEGQERSLRAAGVLVAPSNAQASRLAALIASRGKLEVEPTRRSG